MDRSEQRFHQAWLEVRIRGCEQLRQELHAVQAVARALWTAMHAEPRIGLKLLSDISAALRSRSRDAELRTGSDPLALINLLEILTLVETEADIPETPSTTIANASVPANWDTRTARYWGARSGTPRLVVLANWHPSLRRAVGTGQ
jgi:hypothetical protein